MKYSATITDRPTRARIERIEANVEDVRFLAQCANNPPGDNSGWNVASCMARKLLELRGLDWQTVEYRAGNYQGSGRIAIMMNGRLLRMEDGLPAEPIKNDASPWHRG